MNDSEPAVFLFACDHFRKEFETVVEASRMEGIAMCPFSAWCTRPPASWTEVLSIIGEVDESRNTLLVGGHCLSMVMGSDDVPGNVTIHSMPQCAYLVATPRLVDALLEEAAYLVTPDWLCAWLDRLLEMGLEGPDISRAFFCDFCSKVVLLDTETEADSHRHLHEFAEFINRPAQRLVVGTGHLRMLLHELLLEYQLSQAVSFSDELARRCEAKMADYAMAMELAGELAKARDEPAVIRALLDFFDSLASPGTLRYVSVRGGRVGEVHGLSPDSGKGDAPGLAERLLETDAEHRILDGDAGVVIKLRQSDEILGLFEMSDFRFPQWGRHYVNLALSLLRVCGLAVVSARSFQELQNAREALRTANLELEVMARTDGLCGVANRRQFNETLRGEWNRMGRNRSPLSLVMCDIDHFKAYNDANGHQQGDDCLVQVAGVLANAAKRPGDLAARYGGEEFAVVLPNTDEEGALVVGRGIRTAVAALEIPHSPTAAHEIVTVSVGVATMRPDAGGDPEALVRAADEALYRAKAQGRNQTVVAQPVVV